MVKTRQDFNLKQMTILDLKKLIESLPDEMPVGVTDHFGDFVDVEGSDFYTHIVPISGENVSVFIIPVVNIGEEPD